MSTARKLREEPRAEFAGIPMALAEVTISDASTLPIYEQICSAVRSAIVNGDLPSGTLLPTVRDLGEFLGVGRNTVVAAYSRLVAEGYISTNRRRGTRVTDLSLSSALVRAANASESVRDISEARNQRSWLHADEIQISYRARKLLESHAGMSFSDARFQVNKPDPLLHPRNNLGRLLAEEFLKPLPPEKLEGVTTRFQTAIANYLRHMRGVECSPQQVFPLAGIEDALELTTRMMIDPGDPVYVEDPAAPSIRGSLEFAGARLISMPADANGADIGAVDGPPPKLVFTSPSVCVPWGQQMSEQRRLQMLDRASQTNCPIFEHDAPWELGFGGNKVRALHGRDPDAPILYYGSFAETLGPHVRVGYLIVPKNWVSAFQDIARRLGLGVPPFILGALTRFIENSDYAVHTKFIRTAYLQRMRALMHSFKTIAPDLTIMEPFGGLQICVALQPDRDEEAVYRATSAAGLPVARLSSFFLDKSKRVNGLVVGFGHVHEHMADTVVRTIADAVRAG